MTAPRGSILTSQGWVAGEVQIAGGRIAGIVGHSAPPGPPYVLPGFIDLHLHGADGRDCMGGAGALRHMLRYHAARGTVAMADIAAVGRHRQPGQPAVLGAHLEGPFINPHKLGAQAAASRDGDAALARRGCRVQVGHSLASTEALAAAFACGCCGFTHLFNAMSGLRQRAPGVLGCALAHAAHAEIVVDLQHVDATASRAARRAIPHRYAIADASSAAGLPDGTHRFVSRSVVKQGARLTLDDGATLAGSAIAMADALRNLMAIGIPLAEASAMTATRQAGYLGRADLGRIAPGARAGLVSLDGDLRVTGVWLDGEENDAAA